jgi:hypothetical protein
MAYHYRVVAVTGDDGVGAGVCAGRSRIQNAAPRLVLQQTCEWISVRIGRRGPGDSTLGIRDGGLGQTETGTRERISSRVVRPLSLAYQALRRG